jgi:hypothetical protein
MVSTRRSEDLYEVDETCHGRQHDKIRKKKRLAKKIAKSELKETRSISRTVESIDEDLSNHVEKKSAETQHSKPQPRSTRSNTDPPSCCDYGKHRRGLYAGRDFFFCQPCDHWDNLGPVKGKAKKGQHDLVARQGTIHSFFLQQRSKSLSTYHP